MNRNRARGGRGSIPRILAIATVASLFVAAFAGTAAAAPGFDVSIPINTVVRAPEGSVTHLRHADVPPEAVGQLCTVESQGQNQQSIHPGNDLIVSSGSSQVLLPDVEAVPGGTVQGDGLLTLGAVINVSLDMGPDEVFSGGFVVVIDCEAQPEPVEVSVSGECVLEGEVGTGVLTVDISADAAASVTIFDEGGSEVATISEDGGTAVVPAGATYTWEATAADGFVLSGDTSGEISIEDCTPPPPPPPPPPEMGEIVVEKIVDGSGSPTFEFTFDTGGFDLGDNTLAHGQSSSSGDLPAGSGYSVSEDLPSGWTLVDASCDDGSDPANIDLSAGEVVTCTFVNAVEDSVQAAIEVTVDGTCELDDDDEGVGLVDITVSVANGATVVVRDSDGDVVGTVTSEGTLEVPEGATYTWEATPAEGFEFPPGADSSGSITIESCSNPETLPFTGIESQLGVFAIILLGAGAAMLYFAPRRWEE